VNFFAVATLNSARNQPFSYELCNAAIDLADAIDLNNSLMLICLIYWASMHCCEWLATARETISQCNKLKRNWTFADALI
jgi:hypothetical protein